MSLDYNVIAEIGRRHTVEAAAQVLEALVEYRPSVSRSSRGRIAVVITLPAVDLRQAVASGLAVIHQAIYPAVIASVEAMTTKEFDSRVDGIEPVMMPELVSVTEAAAALGVSRQAVLQRIESGSLSATQVGNTWVIPKASMTRA